MKNLVFFLLGLCLSTAAFAYGPEDFKPVTGHYTLSAEGNQNCHYIELRNLIVRIYYTDLQILDPDHGDRPGSAALPFSYDLTGKHWRVMSEPRRPEAYTAAAFGDVIRLTNFVDNSPRSGVLTYDTATRLLTIDGCVFEKVRRHKN